MNHNQEFPLQQQQQHQHQLSYQQGHDQQRSELPKQQTQEPHSQYQTHGGSFLTNSIEHQSHQQASSHQHRHSQSSVSISSFEATSNPTLKKKGRWSPTEDNRLRSSIRQHGPNKWKLVAQDVRTRDGDQCWKRWNDSLDPTLDHSPWTPVEDEILETAVLRSGRLWSKIASENLERRSGLACKNRWDHIQRKQRRMHQSQRDVLQTQRDVLQYHVPGRVYHLDQSFFNDHRSMGSLANTSAESTSSRNKRSLHSINNQRSNSFGSSVDNSQLQEEENRLSNSMMNKFGTYWRNYHQPFRTQNTNSSASTFVGASTSSNNSLLNNSGGTLCNSAPSPYVGHITSFTSPMTDSKSLPLTSNYSSAASAYASVAYPSYLSNTLGETGGTIRSSTSHHRFNPNSTTAHSHYAGVGAIPGPLLNNSEAGGYTGGSKNNSDYSEEAKRTNESSSSAFAYQSGNVTGSDNSSSSSSNSSHNNTAPPPAFLQSFTPYSQRQDSSTPTPTRTIQSSSLVSRSSHLSNLFGHPFIPNRPSIGFNGRSELPTLPFPTTRPPPLLEREDQEENVPQSTLSAIEIPKLEEAARLNNNNNFADSSWHSESIPIPRGETDSDDYQDGRMSPSSHPFSFSPEIAGDQRRQKQYPPGIVVYHNEEGENERVRTSSRFQDQEEDAMLVGNGPSYTIHGHRDMISPLTTTVKVEEVCFFDDFEIGNKQKERMHSNQKEVCQDDEVVTSDEEEEQDDRLLSKHDSFHQSLARQGKVNLFESRLGEDCQQTSHYL